MGIRVTYEDEYTLAEVTGTGGIVHLYSEIPDEGQKAGVTLTLGVNGETLSVFLDAAAYAHLGQAYNNVNPRGAPSTRRTQFGKRT